MLVSPLPLTIGAIPGSNSNSQEMLFDSAITCMTRMSPMAGFAPPIFATGIFSSQILFRTLKTLKFFDPLYTLSCPNIDLGPTQNILLINNTQFYQGTQIGHSQTLYFYRRYNMSFRACSPNSSLNKY